MKKIILAMSMLISTSAIVFAQDNQEIAIPANQGVLVGQDSSTWTPAYLSVDKFKDCLSVQNMRGWEGYCMPDDKPDNCPSNSWDELEKMNLILCQK